MLYSPILMIYVGKHGNDNNDGKNINKAVLTFTKAIQLVNAQSPSSSNVWGIICVDGGIYSENVTLTDNYVHIFAANAVLEGMVTLLSETSVEFEQITKTSGTAVVLSSGSGTAYIHVKKLHTSGTANGISNSSSGILNTEIEYFIQDGGVGLECSSGIVHADIQDWDLYGTSPVAVRTASGMLNVRSANIADRGGSGTSIALDCNGGTTNAVAVYISTDTCYEVEPSATLNLIVANCLGAEINNGGTINTSSAGNNQSISYLENQVTDIQESLDGYALTSHTHTLADVTDSGALAALNTVGTSEIDNDAVTYAKMQNVSATDRVLGRDSVGAGVVEEITPAALRTMINVEDGATADQTAGEIEAAVNHDNLVGFVADEHIDWTVDQGGTNIDPGNYTDTVYTHPNHTGEVTSTGDGAQVLDKTAITNKTTVTPVSGDFVLISDTGDSGNLKKVDANDFLSGGGGGDVTAASNITDNRLVRGDGGAKGVQESLWSIDDNGVLSAGFSYAGYILDVHNTKADGGGNGFCIMAGELLGDIAFHVADENDTFQIMELEADQGHCTFGKTYAQTLTDNGIVYGIDLQQDGVAKDFNTQYGTYRIGGEELTIGHLLDASNLDGYVVGPGSATDHAVARYDGTTGKLIQNSSVTIDDNGHIDNSEGRFNGYRHYAASATDPVSPTPSEGDIYYNTTLEMEMRYDGSRSKWLSTEVLTLQFGRSGSTSPGAYYRGINGMALTSTRGYSAHFNGTIVSMSITRSDTDSATFEVEANGSSIATLASSSVNDRDSALDADFSQDQVLSFKNQTGGNTTSNVQGWCRVKWRA